MDQTKCLNSCLSSHKTVEQSAPVPSLGSRWKEIQGASDWEGLLDPMDDDLRAEIIRYGKFTQVCYDSFDSDPHSKYCGSCKFNKRKLFAKVGMQDCGYEVTKYIYATSHFPFKGALSLPISGEKWSSDSNWMGYVAVCTSDSEIRRLGRRDILVCWRGTETPTEWAENFRDVLVSTGLETRGNTNGNAKSRSLAKVERGFLSLYTSKAEGSSFYNHVSAREQLLPELRRLLELYKEEEVSITITGHSLGGALALLSAYDVAQRCNINGVNIETKSSEFMANKVVPITAFTFGCPRLGNRAFKDECGMLNAKILRVVNKNDVVPKVPGIVVNETLRFLSGLFVCLPWTYFHVGIPLSLDNKHSPCLRRTQNLQYLHSLETYLHLVDGYMGMKGSKLVSHGRDPALVNKYTGFLKDEQRVPNNWWQEQNKGLWRNEKGMWVERERDVDDQPHNCIL